MKTQIKFSIETKFVRMDYVNIAYVSVDQKQLIKKANSVGLTFVCVVIT